MSMKSSVISQRRERKWVPTANRVATLSRSARQLARSSASRISRPEVAACLAKYRYVAAVESACKLLRADLLVELIDGHGLRAIDIARETGERPSDISQMYRTAKAFPLAERPDGVSYNLLLLAAWMARRFDGLGYSAAESLDEIRRAGLSQHRDVTRHFSRLELSRGQCRLLLPAPASPELFDCAHHCPFQALLCWFPDRSINLLNFDPPYVYGDVTYGSRSARSLACDNANPAAAVAVVMDMLRDWQPKLAPGGIVLLWQPWQTLLPQIAEAILDYRWQLIGPVIWDKGRPQPGRFDSPYSSQGEMLWVLHRSSDIPVNHDGSSRQMVVRFPPVSVPNLAHAQEHCFEKPLALCEFLVRKHTRPGGVVFDACGCTGVMSVAALNCGRRWVYAESNAENYRLGTSRIASRLAQATSAAS